MCPAWGISLALTSRLPSFSPPSFAPQCGHCLMPARPEDTRPCSGADAHPLMLSLGSQAWSCVTCLGQKPRAGVKSLPTKPLQSHAKVSDLGIRADQRWTQLRLMGVSYHPKRVTDRARAFTHSPAIAVLSPFLSPKSETGHWSNLAVNLLRNVTLVTSLL